MHFQLGQTDRALENYSEAYEARKALQGGDHADSVYCLNGMANCFARQERYDEAEDCYEEVGQGKGPISSRFPLGAPSFLSFPLHSSLLFLRPFLFALSSLL